MSDTAKPDLQQLNPEELVQYQSFFQSQGKMFAEIGKLTMEYEAMLDQAKQATSQLQEATNRWVLRALSARGINPVTGQWEIDPMTGHILNKAKLHVVNK